MPFDGSGTFNRVMNWVNDAAAGIKIKSDRHDQEDDNFAAGLSNTLTKDGQSQPTANIPMNGKKLVNLGAPTVGTDAATKGYVDTADTAKVAGPAASVDGNVAAFSGTTGKIIMDGGFLVSDIARKSLGNTFATTQNITLPNSQAIGVAGGPAAGTHAFLVTSPAAGAAFFALNRNTAYAINFGLDTDNLLKVGGWSMGAVAYRIMHEGLASGTFTGNFTFSGTVNFSGTLQSKGSTVVDIGHDRLDLAAGFGVGAYIGDGAKSGGATYQPTAAGGNFRLVQNSGAFNFTADADATAKAYTLIVLVQNTATAGSVTFSGWTAVTGDALTTVNGALFMCTIIKHGGVKTINIQAL